MKVLIFGKDGQLATCLRNNKLENYEYVFVTRRECDLSIASDIEITILNNNPDIIINASAYTDVEACEDINNYKTAESVNALALKYIGKHSNSLNIPVIHISTDYVFDGGKLGSYNELDLPNPINAYGNTKLLGEKYLINENRKHLIIRASWLFSEYGSNFLTKIIYKIRSAQDKLTIVNDQIGAPTYCVDLAKAINTILSTYSSNSVLNYGIYHYSGFPYGSWYDFANEILKNISQNEKTLTKITPISTNSLKLHADRPMNSSLDFSSIIDVYKIQPSDWKLAIEKIINKGIL